MTSSNSPIAVLAGGQSQLAQVGAEDQLPPASAIIRTCAVTPVGGPRHPVLATAKGLAVLHEQRAEAQQLISDPTVDDHAQAAAARTVAAADIGRSVLVDRIDRWACATLPESRHAAVHTESLGRMVDRMTGTWTRWNVAKDCEDPAGADVATTLLQHLSELSIGDDDLVADLAAGRRRLPRRHNPVVA
jgi:hypothetical protein